MALLCWAFKTELNFIEILAGHDSPESSLKFWDES